MSRVAAGRQKNRCTNISLLQLDNKIKLMSSVPAPVKSLKGCKVTNVIVEESACIGSHCIMPEPAIRILKRPSSLASGQLNGESRARPVKTLEQRQKEYEQARLRILGEARSPEDVIDDKYVRMLLFIFITLLFLASFTVIQNVIFINCNSIEY